MKNKNKKQIKISDQYINEKEEKEREKKPLYANDVVILSVTITSVLFYQRNQADQLKF